MRHTRTPLLNAKAVTEEMLTPKQYIALSGQDKGKIKSTAIAPPVLGKRGFGGVKVTYKAPEYRVL